MKSSQREERGFADTKIWELLDLSLCLGTVRKVVVG